MKIRSFPQLASVRLAIRGYQAVIALYPSVFRREYGEEMLSMFQERCLEIYGTGKIVRLFHWFLVTLAEELRNVYKEYKDMMEEPNQSKQDARGAMRLGVIYLIGTWVALFILAGKLFPVTSRGIVDIIPAAALVLINALFVGHAISQSERFEYVPGMVALLNTFLLTSLLALQGGLNSSLENRMIRDALALTLQGTFLVGHGWLVWHLRGDDFFTKPLIQNGET